jgi:hypothetical protein
MRKFLVNNLKYNTIKKGFIYVINKEMWYLSENVKWIGKTNENWNDSNFINDCLIA